MGGGGWRAPSALAFSAIAMILECSEVSDKKGFPEQKHLKAVNPLAGNETHPQTKSLSCRLLIDVLLAVLWGGRIFRGLVWGGGGGGCFSTLSSFGLLLN